MHYHPPFLFAAPLPGAAPPGAAGPGLQPRGDRCHLRAAAPAGGHGGHAAGTTEMTGVVLRALGHFGDFQRGCCF